MKRSPMPPRRTELRSGPIARKSPMPPRKTPMQRRSRGSRTSHLTPEQKARKAAETLRTMGTPARQRWMREQPCLVCGSTPSENSHNHTDGMSRRADACHIVPLCAQHHRLAGDSFHALGSVTRFDAVHGTDLRATAARLDAEWEARDTNPSRR